MSAATMSRASANAASSAANASNDGRRSFALGQVANHVPTLTAPAVAPTPNKAKNTP